VPHLCHFVPPAATVGLVTGSRSSWGSVRKLPSGRWQARYRVEHRWRTAPTTYTTKREAESYLAATRAALEHGSWIDPQRGQVTLRECPESSFLDTLVLG